MFMYWKNMLEEVITRDRIHRSSYLCGDRAKQEWDSKVFRSLCNEGIGTSQLLLARLEIFADVIDIIPARHWKYEWKMLVVISTNHEGKVSIYRLIITDRWGLYRVGEKLSRSLKATVKETSEETTDSFKSWKDKVLDDEDAKIWNVVQFSQKKKKPC